jgi:hypothetical protein
MRALCLGCIVISAVASVNWAMAQTYQVDQEATAISQQPETATLDNSMIMVAPAQEASPTDPSLAMPVDDPEALKERIRQLKEQNQALAGERDSLQATINEMTALGGTLVTAYCASHEISHNTAGAEEDCSSAGYVCAPVSGLCHTTCQSTDHCARGFACDVAAGRCVPAY